MQDHYFKYVCTDGKTIFYAIHKDDLNTFRNNDIESFMQKRGSEAAGDKEEIEKKYQIITCYPAKMTMAEIQDDLDILGLPTNGTVVDADFQDIINIMNNARGHSEGGAEFYRKSFQD